MQPIIIGIIRCTIRQPRCKKILKTIHKADKIRSRIKASLIDDGKALKNIDRIDRLSKPTSQHDN